MNDTNLNYIKLLSFGGEGRKQTKHTFKMNYVSIWDDNPEIEQIKNCNKWLPFTDNCNKRINIGRYDDNYHGTCAVSVEVIIIYCSLSNCRSNMMSMKMYFNFKHCKFVRQFHGHSGYILKVHFFPDGLFALSCSNDYTVRIWDVKSGKEFKKLEGYSNGVWDTKYSPDDLTVISCSNDQMVRLWNLQLEMEIQKLVLDENVAGIDISPDGNIIVSCSGDKAIQLWKVL
ncbi:hypothetical protein RFI_22751 [Reticulomyxa filosa]|uniref:Uncharacterized protein n=1 Tax=Reticulomyxa filosa TaxID=46433 RepID=X6MMF2_RETFI|nr:hypothetical protein RFI_22751 [Reticulomyxa filosa]|eukprot:ETO14617.1 hypothetical protein RFI_22751 [Reticulomyxa filosa]